jgi:hypothetical protein
VGNVLRTNDRQLLLYQVTPGCAVLSGRFSRRRLVGAKSPSVRAAVPRLAMLGAQSIDNGAYRPIALQQW